MLNANIRIKARFHLFTTPVKQNMLKTQENTPLQKNRFISQQNKRTQLPLLCLYVKKETAV